MKTYLSVITRKRSLHCQQGVNWWLNSREEAHSKCVLSSPEFNHQWKQFCTNHLCVFIKLLSIDESLDVLLRKHLPPPKGDETGKVCHSMIFKLYFTFSIINGWSNSTNLNPRKLYVTCFRLASNRRYVHLNIKKTFLSFVQLYLREILLPHKLSIWWISINLIIDLISSHVKKW